MHQTDLHLFGTAPPMISTSSVQSLPEPPLIPGCGQRAYVAGGEGLHAPLEPHGNVQPANVVSENRHEQASSSRTPQNSMHAGSPCTHSNAFSNTTSQAGPAVQSKHCTGQRPTLPCGVLVSSRQRHVRARSAHTSKGECMATSVTSLPQIVVR